MIFQQRHAAHCVVKMCKLVLQVEKKKKEEKEGKNLDLAPNCLPRAIFEIPVPPCWNTHK